MKCARVLGAAAAAMAGLTFSAPAAHAAPPTITLHSPGERHTETNVRIAGEVSMPTSGGTVHGQLVMKLESRDGRPEQSHIVNVNGNPVPFSWDVAAPYNGNYTVRVEARGRDGAVDPNPNEVGHAVRDITVDALPAPPANVRVQTDAKRQTTVRWDPNPEPDLIGYQVQRRLGDEQPDDPGGWKPAGDTTGTELLDTATANAGGTYHYRVYAVRRGSAANSAWGSLPSETKSVNVANPPATTTTTTTGNGGNGGNGGGNGGTGGDGGSRGGGSGSPLAQTGKVDLSGFSALLQNARRTDPATGRPLPDDGTYDETLPFKPGEGEEELGEDGTALGLGVEEAGADEGRPAIAFFAASLLATVIVMHLLWLKREVDKVPDGALETAEG